MRFGRPLWSEHNGQFKYELLLIDKRYDEENRAGFLEPDWSAMQYAIAHSAEAVDLILTALVQKEGLSGTEADKIRESSTVATMRRQLDFRKVPDLDEWPH